MCKKYKKIIRQDFISNKYLSYWLVSVTLENRTSSQTCFAMKPQTDQHQDVISDSEFKLNMWRQQPTASSCIRKVQCKFALVWREIVPEIPAELQVESKFASCGGGTIPQISPEILYPVKK